VAKLIGQELQGKTGFLGSTPTSSLQQSFRHAVDQATHQEAVAQVTIRAAELRRRQRADATGAERPISQTETKSVATTMNPKVFVIHGHDEAKRRELKELLETRFGLEVIIMQERAGRSRTFIEKFEQEAGVCIAAIALLTPDDIINEEGEEHGQPRPNVVFELGWFAGKYGRNRTLMVVREGTKVPSDLFGIEVIFFKKDVAEKIPQLEKEITTWKSGVASHVSPKEQAKPRVKWGCYVFENDDNLYCPACFETKGKKHITTRMNTRQRQCVVCGRILPSG
jgi:predicted nucleotide-binding protein